MLSQLTIHNFGLIDRLSVEFCRGLNVFTGETGAGKSIIIDAMRCALGERMSSSLLRDPSKPGIVEAVFDLGSSPHVLSSEKFAELVCDDEHSLIIRRVFLPDGRGKISVNGLSVTLSQLKELGDGLMDLHGPHDHQLLFSESSHIDIVDRLAGIDSDMGIYTKVFGEYSELQKSLRDLASLASSREVELETLENRIKELEQVSLEETEYNKVIEESLRTANSEKLHEEASELMEILENEDSGFSASFRRAFLKARALSGIDPSMADLNGSLERAQSEMDLIVSSLSDYLEKLSFSPRDAEETARKHDAYYDILRKYGPSLEDARKLYKGYKEKYALLLDMESNTADISGRLREIESKLRQLASKISSKRVKTGKNLQSTIEKELKDLGMPHIKFDCRIESSELSFSGTDKVSFYISPNAGEDLKPLAKIVSSGEAARVMLALKKALIKADPIPCLVFDEIDSQIGGRLGSVTGKKLKELSSNRQIILITHLPQIASFADRHIKVSKKISSGRTSVTVKTLEGPERTDELAKMMSGARESRIAMDLAEELLEKAKK